MAQHRPLAARQNCCRGPLDRVGGRSPDGVDAPVQPMQAAASEAVGDSAAAQAEFQQLLAADVAVLRGGDLGDGDVDHGSWARQWGLSYIASSQPKFAPPPPSFGSPPAGRSSPWQSEARPLPSGTRGNMVVC